MRMYNNYFVIKDNDNEKASSTGIIVNTNNSMTSKGEVIFSPGDIKEGEIILYKKAGRIKYEDFYIIESSDIIGVYTNEDNSTV